MNNSFVWIIPGLSRKEEIQAATIIDLVCGAFNSFPSELKSRTRISRVNSARQVAAFLIRRYTKLNTADIGSLFNRSHPFAVHSTKMVEDTMLYNRKFRKDILDLEDILRREEWVRNR